ncbi:MAG: DUF1273 domain-containing protein [Clostridiales bacterium]|nr:DUF1273 domain-containing protein [Clostridiales bacterium]
MRKNTCCFTGHRRLPDYKAESIKKRLDQEVENLINQGVTDFISGGAIGFDLMAAAVVAEKKKHHDSLRLIFALPCGNHNARWSSSETDLLHSLLTHADEVICLCDAYTPDCMRKRNEYMVNHSAHCICALIHQRTGTSQTVNFAQRNALQVINVAD